MSTIAVDDGLEVSLLVFLFHTRTCIPYGTQSPTTATMQEWLHFVLFCNSFETLKVISTESNFSGDLELHVWEINKPAGFYKVRFLCLPFCQSFCGVVCKFTLQG